MKIVGLSQRKRLVGVRGIAGLLGAFGLFGILSVPPSAEAAGDVRVHRLYNGQDTLLTLDPAEGQRQGYHYEGVAFTARSYAFTGDHPIFRCYSPGTKDHFIALDSRCDGQTYEGLLGYLVDFDTTVGSAVYDCFNHATADHLVTKDRFECLERGYYVQSVLGFEPAGE